MTDRILPQSAFDFLDDVETRCKAVSRAADEIADLCFSGIDYTLIKTKRVALLEIKRLIDMDIAGINLQLKIASSRLTEITVMNDYLFALYAASKAGDREAVDEAIGRYGCRTEDYFGE